MSPALSIQLNRYLLVEFSSFEIDTYLLGFIVSEPRRFPLGRLLIFLLHFESGIDIY
jgi:hypothetical protein